MNIPSEFIDIVGKDQLHLQQKLNDLVSQIEDKKIDLYDLLNQKQRMVLYTGLDDARSLSGEIESCLGKIDVAKDEIDSDLSAEDAVCNLLALQKQLTAAEMKLMLVDKLLVCRKQIDEAKQNLHEDQILPALTLTAKLEQNIMCFSDTLSEVNGPKEATGNLVTGLNTEVTAIYKMFGSSKEQATIVSLKCWDSMIIWCISSDSSSLSILSQLNTTSLRDLFVSLDQLEELPLQVQKFSKHVQRVFISPLCTADNQLFDIRIDRKDTFKTTISIFVEHEDSVKTCSNIKAIEKTIEDLLNILDVVRNQFFGLFPDGQQRPCQDIFSKLIFPQLVSDLVQHRFSTALPSEMEEFQKYREALKKVHDFLQHLESLHYSLGNSSDILTSFGDEISSLYLSKKCAHYLDKARQLIQADFSQVTQVGTVPKSSDESSPANEDEMIKFNLPSSDQLQLSRCCVSKNVIQIAGLIRDVLSEAASQSISNYHETEKLIDVVRRILELFAVVRKDCHKSQLSSNPKLAAIFSTDAFYLAQHCIVYGPEVSHYSSATTFTDYALRLRRLSNTTLSTEIQRQCNLLLEYVRKSQGFQCSNRDIFETTQRITEHLIEIQALWLGILPEDTYFNAMGTLVNSVLKAIITSVVQMEDICASDAATMCTQFTSFYEHIESIFGSKSIDTSVDNSNDSVSIQPHETESPKKEILLVDDKYLPQMRMSACVEQLDRFKELLFVLNAKLSAVMDRWCEAQGPLAAVYSAEEVRHLIRALFQNTDKRAAALTRIRS